MGARNVSTGGVRRTLAGAAGQAGRQAGREGSTPPPPLRLRQAFLSFRMAAEALPPPAGRTNTGTAALRLPPPPLCAPVSGKWESCRRTQRLFQENEGRERVCVIEERRADRDHTSAGNRKRKKKNKLRGRREKKMVASESKKTKERERNGGRFHERRRKRE